MPKRKSPYPYRKGYRLELAFPRRGNLPTHGSGPRCRVDFNPSDDGPWSMLQIMRVEDEGGEVEEYTCAMPRYYAVPLILMNKRLAWFEASCHPDGTSILPPPRTTTTDKDTDGATTTTATTTANGGGRGGGVSSERDLREYAYLWQLRTRFLQAVFDMNHERRLDERWRHDGFHAFAHRLYRRYGHETSQRILYWRDEIKAGRVPYAMPDIADMGMCVCVFFLFNVVQLRALFTLRHTPVFFYSRFFSLYIPPSSMPVHEGLARGQWTRAGCSIYPCEINRAGCCASPHPWEPALLREVRT